MEPPMTDTVSVGALSEVDPNGDTPTSAPGLPLIPNVSLASARQQ
jgi:hypothetical protein